MFLPQFTCYDGDPKTYTQEEFDQHMAGIRRKFESDLKKTQQDLTTQLEKAKTAPKLTDEERTALQSQIDELESKYLTSEQKSERTRLAAEEKFKTEIDGLRQEGVLWKTQYEQEKFRSQTGDAATANKAVRPEQIRAILQPMTKFEKVESDNGASYVPVVHFPDKDAKTNKPITMQYTVDEAVKRMRELPEYGNLFEDTMKSGLSGGRNADPRKVDVAALAKTDPAAYRKLRKENPSAVYGGKGN